MAIEPLHLHSNPHAKDCKICGCKTLNVFNLNFKPVPICEVCSASIFLQQATWYVKSKSS